MSFDADATPPPLVHIKMEVLMYSEPATVKQYSGALTRNRPLLYYIFRINNASPSCATVCACLLCPWVSYEHKDNLY